MTSTVGGFLPVIEIRIVVGRGEGERFTYCRRNSMIVEKLKYKPSYFFLAFCIIIIIIVIVYTYGLGLKFTQETDMENTHRHNSH